MSALALSNHAGVVVGLSAPSAGPDARTVSCMTLEALRSLKTRVSAGSSLVFLDLHKLAREQGTNSQVESALLLAERFLLALPSHLSTPELDIDADGEVALDWSGPGGRMLTVALRGDGRLSYAARLSARDKENGTKEFVDSIPKPILDLVQQVARA